MGAMPRDAVMRTVTFTGGPMRVAPVAGPVIDDTTRNWGAALERLCNENAALRRQLTERDVRIIQLGARLQRQAEQQEHRAAIDEVLDTIAKAFGMSRLALTGELRAAHAKRARQMAAALLLELRVDMSLRAVGTACGYGGGDSVTHSVRMVHDRVRAGAVGPEWAQLRAALGLPVALPERVAGMIWTYKKVGG